MCAIVSLEILRTPQRYDPDRPAQSVPKKLCHFYFCHNYLPFLPTSLINNSCFTVTIRNDHCTLLEQNLLPQPHCAVYILRIDSNNFPGLHDDERI